jgi:hypothetical protein
MNKFFSFFFVLCFSLTSVSGQELLSIKGCDGIFYNLDSSEIDLAEIAYSGKALLFLNSINYAGQSDWDYFNTTTLSQFNAEYGPDGLDKVRIVAYVVYPYIDCLSGSTNCTESKGDWLSLFLI